MKFLSKYVNRTNAAHLLISGGIITLALGISIVHLGVGIASGGLLAVWYGYILGAE